MSLVYLKHKKSGVTYVYECQSFWNKEKKRSDSKRTCIGKLHLTTGELIPSKRHNPTCSLKSQPTNKIATIKSIGATLLFDHICEKTGLAGVLKKSFPEDWQMLLSLAYYQAIEGKPLSRVEHWSQTHQHPHGEFIDNRRVSELLPTITEERQLGFFKFWAKKRLEEEYLAYDITSVSSYSEQNEMVKYGYNRDEEALPQINLALLFGQKTRLPVYYKSLPGSIRDVSTLYNFLETATFLHMGKLKLVMDKGFYSHKNVSDLFRNHVKFTIAIPFSSRLAREYVERVRNEITDHKNFIKVNDQHLVCVSTLTKCEQRKRIYVHVFYNASAASADYESFLNKMALREEELRLGEPLEDHQKFYDTYFTVKETPKRGRKITYNQEAINAYKTGVAGFLVLLSNDIKDPIEALKTYRNKDVVEKAFDNLKNCLDSKRLRVHLQENMRGRLFIQFLALILVSYIQKAMSEKDLFRFGSLSHLLEELELMRMVKYEGHYGNVTSESTKRQREIFDAFGIDLKTYV